MQRTNLRFLWLITRLLLLVVVLDSIVVVEVLDQQGDMVIEEQLRVPGVSIEGVRTIAVEAREGPGEIGTR
jgi:hypothetical protein